MSTVEFQLWLIVGLLVVFVAGYFYFAYAHLQMHKVKREPGFGHLWDTNQFDELILQARSTLIDTPNNQSALYFGGKAFRAVGRLDDAKIYFERLLALEPTLRKEIQPELDEIARAQGTTR